MKNFYAAALCAALCALPLAACTPVSTAAGIGASIGIAAAQEGGIRGALSDKSIYLKISDLWVQHSVDMYRRLSLNVREGRVLVAGAVPNADMRMDAVRLAWQADGVTQVINEVTVEEGTGVTGLVTDGVITGNLKTQMVFDSEVQSINYNIETVNGTVYLMGVARDRRELDHALELARNTRGVENVVSYVRLLEESDIQRLPVKNTVQNPAGPANIEPAAGPARIEHDIEYAPLDYSRG